MQSDSGPGSWRGRVSRPDPGHLTHSLPSFPAVVTTAALVLAYLALTATGAPLTFDGSNYLFSTLNAQSPFVAENRWANLPLIYLTLLAGQLSQSVAVATLVFSAMYALTPFVSLLLCWLIARTSRPWLFVWPALGIGLVCLPGVFFFVAEPMSTAELFWPTLMAVLCLSRWRRLLVATALALVLSCYHPTSVVALLVCAGAAVALAWRERAQRRHALLLALALLGVAGARLMVPLSAYEEGVLNLSTIEWSFRYFVYGLPLLAVSLGLLTAGCVLASSLADLSRRPAHSRLCGAVAYAGIVAAGLVLSYWALTPALWAGSLDYRYWALALGLPFAALATADRLGSRDRVLAAGGRARQRQGYVGAILVVFSLVLLLQSGVWYNLGQRLDDELGASGKACVAREDIPWLRDTLYRHWFSSQYAVIRQGRAPAKLMLREADCLEVSLGTKVRLVPWGYTERNGGWFDLSRAGLGQPPTDTTYLRAEEADEVLRSYLRPDQRLALGNGLQLVGYKPPAEARPGERLELRLLWQMPANANDYPAMAQILFAHLGDAAGTVVAQEEWSVFAYQRLGRPGDYLLSTYSLALPSGGPGLFWLELGAYDRAARQPARWLDVAGKPLTEGYKIGPFRVPPPVGLNEPQTSAQYVFGRSLQLDGYDLSAGEAAGGGLDVTLHWQARAATAEDYAISVQLLDAAGKLVAQHDGPPVGGNYPTSYWQLGERVLDLHHLALAPALRDGTYRLLVVVYSLRTQARLPVAVGDAAPLLSLEARGGQLLPSAGR